MRKNILKLILAALFLLSFVVKAEMDVDSDHERARDLRAAGKILPLESIMESVQLKHPGRIIEIELKHKQDRYLYEIELLDDDGVVWEFLVDAQNAEIVKMHED